MASYQYVYVMKDLTKAYPGGREVFKGITLSFLPGVKIGVLGVNGAGKSTLLKIMAGVEKEYGGEAWAAEGVRLARIAPSAVNRQPWRFELDQGAVTVSVVGRGAEGSVSRLLDVGIAMLHFEVGARLMGAQGTWELLEAPRVALFRPNPR